MTTQLSFDDICANRHRGSPESREANKRAGHGKAAQRGAILELIRNDEAGLTVDEASFILQTTPNAISGRFTELKALGLIRKVGTRQTRSGSPAGVYVLV